MKTEEILNHFTPLDTSILEGDHAYDDYFGYVTFALDNLITSIDQYQTDNPMEVDIIRGFCQRFLHTMEAFRLKYAFNETHPMLIDLTESGFPNHMEFQRLEGDLNARNEKLSQGQSEETLRTLVLDHLIRKREHPERLLKEISTRSFFEKISRDKLLTTYTEGELKLLSNKKAIVQRLLYSWASYDNVTNRPFIYILVFDHNTMLKDSTYKINNAEFKEHIRKITHNMAPLNVMISDIDDIHEDIHPKILKRIDLGPIYGRFSQDDHFFTKLLREKFTDEDIIMTYETEVIFSIGEKRNKSFLSQGELRQIFYIDESNKECMEKMVSKVHKYMITSHSVWQYLSEYHEDILKNLATKPTIYKNT